MEQRSMWSETFALLKEDQSHRWKRPPSWWNLWILLPVLAMFLWSVHNSLTDFETAKRQRVTVATIGSHDPPNHDRYGYLFSVNSEQYKGWAYPSDKVSYSLGEQIAVHYDPLDPTHNLPARFEDAAVRDLFFAPFCLLVVAGLPLFIFVRRRSLGKGL